MELMISRNLIPLIMPSANPISAPAPAPSVGVKIPNQMPPKTATMTRIIPTRLTKNWSVETSSSSDPDFPAVSSIHDPMPTAAGRRSAIVKMYTINRKARSRPGKMPAAKSWPMDCSVKMPHTIINTEGGISIPRQLEPAMDPSAKPR